jgi:hypothetical protein
MSIQIIRGENGHDVYHFVTPSGVVGIVATCVPDEALTLLMRKLKRKLRDGERRRAREALAGAADAPDPSPQG